LQEVKRGFVKLLSVNDWPLVSYGISSLCTFGTTLNVAHQHILRPCLPDSCLTLFQCRVSKKPWEDKKQRDDHVEKNDISIALRIGHHLSQLGVSRIIPDQDIFFPSPALISIDPGSYVLEMTTQEGRTAMVFFPPGPQSLQDIEYMLGGTEEPPSIQTLMRVDPSPLGGIKCLMHKRK
jgi:hypothetical protein